MSSPATHSMTHKFDKFILRFQIANLIFCLSFLPFVQCGNLYNRLCTPSRYQIDELINRAFIVSSTIHNLSLSSRWTHEEHLRAFCARVGYENDKLPELIKISKLPSNLPRFQSGREQVDVVLTIKVPINKFFVDRKRETAYRFWLIHKWPFEPFYCPICRSFLTYSTERKTNEKNKISFIYGVMQNRYPSIVDPERFETIKREVKDKFYRQVFEFSGIDQQESIRTPTELFDTFSTQIDETASDNATNRIDILINNSTASNYTTLSTIASNHTTLSTTASNHTLSSTTPSITSSTTSSATSSTTLSTISSTTSSTTSSATTYSMNTTTTELSITTSNESYVDLEQIKETVYVNLSTFTERGRYFLVGMNMLNSDLIITSSNGTVNQSTRVLIRARREAEKPLLINQNGFYLEYSLCYNLMLNQYLPTTNCYPIYVEDQLNFKKISKPLSVADCICWDFHAYKSFIFYQTLLLFILLALFTICYTMFSKARSMKHHIRESRYEYTNTPGQIMNPEAKIVIYQIILQIHNPNDDKCRLPGRLNVKLFTNLNQPFYEVEFTSTSKFCRPFLYYEDILQTYCYIYSDTVLDNVKKLVVEFEGNDDRFPHVYLYGVTITSGLGSPLVFPYSNYLIHLTEVHLSERAVWQRYMSRHENYIPLTHILPITAPINIRLSKVERIMIYMFFICRFGPEPLIYKEYEDVHPVYLFIFDFLLSVCLFIFYVVLFVIYFKRTLIKDYYLIRLNHESYETKFLCLFLFLIQFQHVTQTTYQMSMAFWKDDITINNIRIYEDILLNNDLVWIYMFFGFIVLFTISGALFESYFYNQQKKQHFIPGPTNSIEDRLIANN